MVNQQKGVQQETAYSAVSPFLYRNMKDDIGRDRDTYDHSLQLHYRQFLVALLFADLPSLSPFIS